MKISALALTLAAAFAVTAFEPIVDDAKHGPLPLNVHKTCTWTWSCLASFFDVHANDEGNAVIARAFANVLLK